MAVEYLMFTFISSFSAIQIVSSIKDKGQIRILKNGSVTIFLSIILILLSYGWFFTVRDRNTQTYMEGVQISAIFVLGAFLSMVLTKVAKKIYEYN